MLAESGIVQPLTDETIQGFDLAIFSAGATTSKAQAPRFAAAGVIYYFTGFSGFTPTLLGKLNTFLEKIEGKSSNGLVKIMKLKVKTRYDNAELLDVGMTVSTWQAG